MLKLALKLHKHIRRMSINVDDFTVVKEGKATILAPKEDKVFYNHIQQFNRDLSVMAIRAWLKQYMASKEGGKELRAKRRKVDAGQKGLESAGPTGTSGTDKSVDSSEKPVDLSETIAKTPETRPFIRILEGLSATGLRAVRYGHEIPHVARVVANDLLPEAVKLINRSVQYNNLEETVVGHQGDAIKYMGSLADAEKFHVVDLDPYGTAAPFIDSAVRLVRDHGMLLVTCTDAGVLAGNGYPEKCFALYGGNNLGNTPMGLELNHEAGIRLILGTIAAAAARYKKLIEPVLSLSIDYYFRVFVRVRTSPLQVKQLASQTMLAYHCVGCGDIIEQRLGRVADKKFQTPRIARIPGENCTFCTRPYHVAGPMWGGALHDATFINDVLEVNSEVSLEVYGTRERIKGMLTLAKHELDLPFYFNLNQLSSFMRAPPISIDEFTRAVGNLGHKVSLTHAKKNCVKTDAPWEKVLQIAVAWLRRSNERLLVDQKQKLAAEVADEKRAKLEAKIALLEANLGSNLNLTEGMVGTKILQTVLAGDSIDFDTPNDQSETVGRLRRLKMVRYQENPTKDWGPKSRPSKK
ncbi:hypothetical protein HF325_005392 [Metschnikowia pulcherrima]|uniref:tRNA (guanine(26)-N(2))-dimethyltransferase n=1 Tax=Metschnikowia pulcherrima TaxID=27326 RepID=A0A8H7LA50_9ASCO|nr:hypothetical protein HF325_005392 [Metschnikowia pulcherrima]